jgi:hypothetical protein
MLGPQEISRVERVYDGQWRILGQVANWDLRVATEVDPLSDDLGHLYESQGHIFCG